MELIILGLRALPLLGQAVLLNGEAGSHSAAQASLVGVVRLEERESEGAEKGAPGPRGVDELGPLVVLERVHPALLVRPVDAAHVEVPVGPAADGDDAAPADADTAVDEDLGPPLHVLARERRQRVALLARERPELGERDRVGVHEHQHLAVRLQLLPLTGDRGGLPHNQAAAVDALGHPLDAYVHDERFDVDGHAEEMIRVGAQQGPVGGLERLCPQT